LEAALIRFPDISILASFSKRTQLEFSISEIIRRATASAPPPEREFEIRSIGLVTDRELVIVPHSHNRPDISFCKQTYAEIF
jgi:hypothetical protein